MPLPLLDGSVLIQTWTALLPRFSHPADEIHALYTRPPVRPDLDVDQTDALARIIPAWQALCTAHA